MNTARTSIKNQSNYDDTSGMVLVCVQYVMSLAKDYDCAVTISDSGKT
jgi:hypothetical protein